MDATFSEFSYGFCVTDAIIQQSIVPLSIAPIFPTLVREAHLGYDVCLEFDAPFYPLFLQFKRPEGLIRPRATKEWTHHQLADLCDRPFYRIPLYTAEKTASNGEQLPSQHNLLVALDTNAPYHNCAYYASAIFHTNEELNTNYIERQILATTAFFSPSDIGFLDPQAHHISYHADAAWCFSHPKKINKHPFHNLVEKFKKPPNSELTLDSLKKLYEQLVSLQGVKASIAELMSWDKNHHLNKKSNQAEYTYLKAISELCSLEFGAQFFIVQPRIRNI